MSIRKEQNKLKEYEKMIKNERKKHQKIRRQNIEIKKGNRTITIFKYKK